MTNEEIAHALLRLGSRPDAEVLLDLLHGELVATSGPGIDDGALRHREGRRTFAAELIARLKPASTGTSSGRTDADITDARTGSRRGGSAAPAPSAASPQPTLETSPSADRPAYVPERFWDADKKTVKADDLGSFFKDADTRATADAERAAAIPATANDYKVELPGDFPMPDGWQINPADPLWKLGAEFAKSKGMTQAEFSQLAKTYVEGQIQTGAKAVEARDAEFRKLGDTGTARVQAVHTFIDATAGTPERAAAVKASLINADAVAYVEGLQATLASAGIKSFARGGEVKADPAVIPGYDKMSFTERFRNRKTA